MGQRIEFYFDFGSPNAYLAYKVMPEIEARLGTRCELKPALLGGIFKATGNQSPAVTLAGVPAKAAYEQRESQRFIQRHGLTQFRFNPAFPINTLQMMRGAMLARRLGVFEAYVAAVYAGMWEQALNLGEAAVFHAVLNAAGLPTSEFEAHIADPDVKTALIASTEEAVARGVFGSPTFFVGDEMFFGKDRLRDVEEEYVRQAAK
ncbi:2-hydroxychromene-2-carboxylate isomerase [Phenylobacterium sp.]|uniref:2-hydroxychromene-2-carboxylate isomerase n=1 Tax=Phenylobacterium sp. TaxID=1871053 RepID=UPI0012275E43|nr:2-hydroxychromene-2-carboxylate isomerase [Phenylobacterium sp.]THD63919.1 MAG: 2-hydroxychromene-2-carboxylate isomerase [Phenylobacterium sp.]